MEKTCRACGISKPLDEFHIEPRNSDNRTGKCRICMLAEQRIWRNANQNRIREARQRYRDKHRERDREIRARSAKAQAEKRKEERQLARIANGLPLLYAREPRITDDGRLCSRCRRRKPTEEFYILSTEKDGLSKYCRECAKRVAREYQRAMTVEQREKKRVYTKKYDIKRIYGISLDDMRELLEKQGGACGICGENLDVMAPRHKGGGAIDHDHATGKVRGILCVKCNAGLGQFRDNEEFLMSAIQYLKASRDE